VALRPFAGRDYPRALRMQASDILQWLEPIARWVHVFAAILWIGQTYLFNFFEKSLEVDEHTKANVKGSLWMVHGGGFYFVEKFKTPELKPRTLHWFKWESAITWISGAILITIVYYMGGALAEPEQNKTLAAGVGIGAIVIGWALYDLLVLSPLGKNDTAIAVIGFLAMPAMVWGFSRVMSPRAAFIHVGAVTGTIMAANVWMRILPSQTKMLAAAKDGKTAAPDLSSRGPQRSKHNSYMVVPLVFSMISNHYPVIFGSSYAWAIFAVAVAGGWIFARHMRGDGAKKEQPAPTPAE
jgi:uncharacterized membrane protein